MRQHGVRFAHRLVVSLSLYFPGPPNVTLYKSETGTPTVKKLVAGCFLVLAKNRGPGPHPGPHYSSTNSALVGCYFGNIPPGLFDMGDYVERHGRLTLSSSPTILTLPYHSTHPPSRHGLSRLHVLVTRTQRPKASAGYGHCWNGSHQDGSPR